MCFSRFKKKNNWRFYGCFLMNFVWSLDDTTFLGDSTQRWMAGFILNFTGLWTIFLRWYVYFQILKKNQIWHFDGYFSYDCCLDFRWFDFLYRVLLRWLGWFIWNFTVAWTIWDAVCYSGLDACFMKMVCYSTHSDVRDTMFFLHWGMCILDTCSI